IAMGTATYRPTDAFPGGISTLRSSVVTPGTRRCTPAEAAALLRPIDTLGIPLGPGHPAALLHPLGVRDDYEDLTIYWALLLDLSPVFTRRTGHCLGGS